MSDRIFHSTKIDADTVTSRTLTLALNGLAFTLAKVAEQRPLPVELDWATFKVETYSGDKGAIVFRASAAVTTP